MKQFIDKYAEDCSEKMALKMIHNKLHKIIKDKDRTEKDLMDFYVMLCDFFETAGINRPNV